MDLEIGDEAKKNQFFFLPFRDVLMSDQHESNHFVTQRCGLRVEVHF